MSKLERNQSTRKDAGEASGAARARRRGTARAGALLLGCGALTTTSAASAASLSAFSASAYGLYGNNMANTFVENVFGPGLDLNLGVTLSDTVYLGTSLRHYFGERTNETVMIEPAMDVERTSSLTQVLGQVGYDWDLRAVLLRPKLGVGYARTSREVTFSNTNGRQREDSSESSWALSPGLEARFPVGLLSACAQLAYDAVLTEPESRTALVLGLGLGLDL